MKIIRYILGFVLGLGAYIVGLVLLFIYTFGMWFWSFSWFEENKWKDYPQKEIPYYVNEIVLFFDELFGIGLAQSNNPMAVVGAHVLVYLALPLLVIGYFTEIRPNRKKTEKDKQNTTE